MSQLSIQILHQDYLLSCPDGKEAQLREAVERVDQQLEQMLDTTKLRSRERIGVLLAVNLAFENLELRGQLQTLQQQMAALHSSNETDLRADDAEAQLLALSAQAEQDRCIADELLQRLDQALAIP